jgi:hypothetical protein
MVREGAALQPKSQLEEFQIGLPQVGSSTRRQSGTRFLPWQASRLGRASFISGHALRIESAVKRFRAALMNLVKPLNSTRKR